MTDNLWLSTFMPFFLKNSMETHISSSLVTKLVLATLLFFLFFRDLALFLYTTTDRAFRSKYLDLCLRTYFATYSKYFTSASASGKAAKRTYENFEREIQERKGCGLSFGLMVINKENKTKHRVLQGTLKLANA